MSVNRIKIVKDDTNKYLNIPINITWDFMGREDSILELETKAIKDVTGIASDFDVAKFSHNIFSNFDTSIFYDFNFYDDLSPISANTVTISNWSSTYLNEGFSVQDVYYFSKPFTKSFFKLDFYDTPDENTQQLYLSVILPIQQGLTQSVILNNIIGSVDIKIPTMVLDSIGQDKEGFNIYWLRDTNFIYLDEFYVTAKFFNGRLGVFKQMTNTEQILITPNRFEFKNADYFYYKVLLDYPTKTYEVFSTSTQLRVGDSTSPIKWYEYVNP